MTQIPSGSSSSLQRQIGNYYVEIRFTSNQSGDQIELALINTQTLESYLLHLNQALLHNNEEVVGWGATPMEIYCRLSDRFDHIKIDQNGRLYLQSTPDGKQKLAYLQTKKENISPQSLLQRQIIQIKQRYLEQTCRREQETGQIKLSNLSLRGFNSDTSFTKIIDETKYEIQAFKYQLNQASKKTASGVSRLESLISDINIQINHIKGDLQQIKGSGMIMSQNEVKSMKADVDKQKLELDIIFTKIRNYLAGISSVKQIEKKTFKNINHPQNPHIDNFQQSMNGDYIKIKRIGPSRQSKNFIANTSLPMGKIHTITMKIVKSEQMEIMFGLCTTNSFGQSNISENMETVIYDMQDNVIWNEGRSQIASTQLEGDETIFMEVDMIEGRIKWFANRESNLIGELLLPPSMYHKHIFPVISMGGRNDEIDIMIA